MYIVNEMKLISLQVSNLLQLGIFVDNVNGIVGLLNVIVDW